MLPEVPFALLAFLFARDYLRAPAGAERTTLLLVSAGFAVFVLYDALTIPFFAADLVGRHAVPLQLAMAASLGAALALLVLLIGTLVWNAATSPEPAVRAHMGRYLIVLGLLVASVALLILLPADGAITPLALVRVLAGLWRLALPLVVTYALLRRHMFGIDLKVQWTIGRGTVGLLVLSIIAGTAESLINFFGNVVGLVAGGLVAALFFLALGPLQRLADRISRAAMPNVRPTQEYFAFRKLEVYKAAFETAMEDGDVTARERRVLATLRKNLGISELDAQTLEGDFRRSASASPGHARTKRGTQAR